MEIHKIIQNYFQQLPFELQLVWILSVFLSLIVVIFVVYLKILRSSLRKKEVLQEESKKRYETLLLSFLFNESEGDNASNQEIEFIHIINTEINDNFNRKIIIETLLKLKNEISGEIEKKIQHIYLQSNLKSFAYQQLESKNWYEIAKGIKELTQFKVEEAYSQIKILINYPKKEVQKEVQLYLVSLFHFEGLKFLSSLESDLSEWDQIELLEELKHLENQEIPEITDWLISKNDSVVMFALKLAKMYNKYENVDTLIQLMNHENQKIRLQVILVLTHLQVLDAKSVLITNFKSYTEEEQVAIFKLLENVFEPSDETFITEHIHSNNFEIQLSALKMLKSINNNTFSQLLTNKKAFENSRVLNFVQNN
ncbi:HEAT repeat domain-containing protein [Lutibacter sp.]